MVSTRKRRKHREDGTPTPAEPVALATVTSKGQITVPKLIRDRFDLRPGDVIEFVEDRGRTLIRRRFDTSVFDEYRGILTSLAGHDPDELLEEWRGR